MARVCATDHGGGQFDVDRHWLVHRTAHADHGGHVVHIKNSGVPGRDGWARAFR